MTDFDFLVFIGRFQPFHKGHLKVLQAALVNSRNVIVMIGSAHLPRSTRNPWTAAEREEMIRACFSKQENERIHIVPLMDIVYNNEHWVKNVQTTVNGLVVAHHNTPHKSAKIGLIGHRKDSSSFYLNLFPQWQSVEVTNYKNISSTPIRESIFNGEIQGGEAWSDYKVEHNYRDALPTPIEKYIETFVEMEAYEHIKEEHDFINKYKSAWENSPYAPTFITVDAIVVQSGHVLLVERKARPGKGLFALPGGFINEDEKLVDACIRELREETRLKVPTPVLYGSIKEQRVFDDPFRSARGRTITHAFYIELQPNSELPKVKGGDDAKRAMWIPLSELTPENLFEDHYFIIQELIGM